MRISLNMLRDLVELPGEQALVDGLTFAGLPVDRVERLGDGLDNVVVARIVESKPHPQADRLSVTQVDAGGERLQIVCGAKNYQVGDLVPLARVGAQLPGGLKIEAAKLRGVDLQGMLCSQRELGISQEHEGLWVLPSGLKPGTALVEAADLQLMGAQDTVLELDLTPNRGDCLSHLGVAREVSAIFRKPLAVPAAAPAVQPYLGRMPAAPQILAPDACGLYLGQVMAGAAFARQSPAWVRFRLEACGVRPIGLAVDVTNYLMLLLGQPLHAFDLKHITAGITVRRARTNESFRTLDGVDRKLHGDDLLICDGDKPLALAGVMGGADSAVDAGTEAIYLEAAWFNPAAVSATARRHGLHTEASHRFERGVDPELAQRALHLAVAGLQAQAPGLLVAAAQTAEGQLPRHRSVRLRYARVSSLLGTEVSGEESRGLLGALGIEASGTDAVAADFSVPSHRFDIEGEADLIEEVLRLRGYDKVPELLPGHALPPPPERPRDRALLGLREGLSAHGFNEAVNYSFLTGPIAASFGQASAVALRNPLKAEQRQLRTSLLPGLCQAVQLNLARLSQAAGAPPTVRLFEQGRTYAWPAAGERSEGPISERERLGLIAYGPRSPVGWATQREAFDFSDLTGLIEELLERLAISNGRLTPGEAPFLHPQTAAQLWIGQLPAGVLGELHPAIASSLELPRGVFVAELHADRLFDACQRPRFSGVPKFPAVLRDVALVVEEGTSAASVEAALRAAGGPLLEGLVLFDIYRGPPLREGRKSLAYSLRFRSPDRTLTDEEVGSLHASLVAAARAQLGAELRS